MLITAGCRANCEWPGKIISSYAGSGIAKLTLVEFTVRVAISRDGATGAERPQKPKAPDDRIMA
jgi:hypothetical protein